MKIQQNLSKVLPYMVSIFCLLLVVSCTTKSSSTSDEASNKAEDDFKGKIALDIRDSEADWSAYTPKSAPKDAPNILFILY